jgi:hypothetical protein
VETGLWNFVVINAVSNTCYVRKMRWGYGHTWREGKDVEGRGRGLFQDSILQTLYFVCGGNEILYIIKKNK